MRRSLLLVGARGLHLLRFFLHDPRLLLRYISTGLVAAAVETVLFLLLYQNMQLPLLAANMLALCGALLLCFTLHKHWTFGMSGDTGRQLRLYLLMQAISMLLNNLLVYSFISLLVWPPLPAKLMQIGFVFIWNFSFSKLVIFKKAALPQARP